MAAGLIHINNLGEVYNSYGNEMRSSITPDGKYLFFGSTRIDVQLSYIEPEENPDPGRYIESSQSRQLINS